MDEETESGALLKTDECIFQRVASLDVPNFAVVLFATRTTATLPAL
jgi:hypothetical protein